MESYDPHQAPDPQEWTALDEAERLLLAEEYHRRKRIRLPNPRVHACMHVIVENQIAMGDELNVARTLCRLMSEGLDRHDALHAIGTVMTYHMFDMSKSKVPFNNEKYTADLDNLTPESWRRMFEED